MINTVGLLRSSHLLSGQPLFDDQWPKSQKQCQLYTNKNLYSVATSNKWWWPTSCFPKCDFFFFYTSIVQPGRLEVGNFQPEEDKRITIRNIVVSLILLMSRTVLLITIIVVLFLYPNFCVLIFDKLKLDHTQHCFGVNLQ